VAGEKTEGPTTLITLLGIELGSINLQLKLPWEKLEKLKELVAKWRQRKVCTKRELQSLAGHLSHACM
jgi:dTDP-4-amino-4,6-dideoxygalactose transaminase